MSALAVDPGPRRLRPLDRTLTMSRVLLANWAIALGFPLGIMGSSFVVNVLVFSGLRDAIETPTTGGLASLYLVQLAVCWQGLHQSFSFAVGLNASRRAYYSGALLVALGQSLFFALFLYGCLLIERATGGWGTHLRFFGVLPSVMNSSPVSILVYAGPLVLLSFLGLFCGTVSKRWGGTGIFVLTVLAIVVAGGLVILAAYLDAWSAVGDWFTSQSWLSITIGWSLIGAVLAAAAGWLVLRRAAP